MKVICIDDTIYNKVCPQIKCGKVYNVLDEKEYDGVWVYLIFVKNGQLYWYWANQFVPLSDIDETQLVNKKQDVCV